jgi:L-serine dehydratase
MESLHELYRIGCGPSASHTMGPRFAAERYLQRHPHAHSYAVILFGSLAATGRGHLTDAAMEQVFAGRLFTIEWRPEEQLPLHPNGMRWYCVDAEARWHHEWEVYSVGGGALRERDQAAPSDAVYELHKMDDIMAWCRQRDAALHEYVDHCEGESIRDHLTDVWRAMQACIEEGLRGEGVLPGLLRVPRKAAGYLERARAMRPDTQRTGLLSAYALAVSEFNASGGNVATAPTCGACGIVPAVLRYLAESLECGEAAIVDALATAGLIGNLVKTNASISGAQVGCQGEVGTACAMAAGAAAQLLGATVPQVEYAAEMGIEHHLGLTCDPVLGMVQIPCIERNAVAAIRAIDCAHLALMSDGEHHVSFDSVVDTMKRTGADMHHTYKETSAAGLALLHVPPRRTGQERTASNQPRP